MGRDHDFSARRKKDIEYIWTAVSLGVAEAFGTGLLVFMGCMGGLPGLTPIAPSNLQAALAFGITVAIAIQIFGHISGAHINPAVTCSAWVWGAIPTTTAVLYVASQLIGGILGYGALWILTPQAAYFNEGDYTNSTHSFCATVPNLKISTLQALLAEFAATSILILLCCGLWDRRNANKQDSTPLKFGFTVAAIAMTEGPFTGASMNPARSLAPALFTGVWDRHWIYWISPCAAGFIITYFYKFVFDHTHTDNIADQSEMPLNQTKKENNSNSNKGSVEAVPNV